MRLSYYNIIFYKNVKKYINMEGGKGSYILLTKLMSFIKNICNHLGKETA